MKSYEFSRLLDVLNIIEDDCNVKSSTFVQKTFKYDKDYHHDIIVGSYLDSFASTIKNYRRVISNRHSYFINTLHSSDEEDTEEIKNNLQSMLCSMNVQASKTPYKYELNSYITNMYKELMKIDIYFF